MSDTKVVAKTPMQLLKQDHRTVKELFAAYAKLGAGDVEEKNNLWQQINEELTIHAEIEERLFYPAVRPDAALLTRGRKPAHTPVMSLSATPVVIDALSARST